MRIKCNIKKSGLRLMYQKHLPQSEEGWRHEDQLSGSAEESGREDGI